MRVFILCAGDGARWDEYLGIPKQHIRIGGETLLERTVRLVKSHDLRDIRIVAHDPRMGVPGCGLVTPRSSRFTAETLLSVIPRQKIRAVFLLGDVFYSERTMSAILTCRSDLRVFGRPWPSFWSGRTHGEIFAIAFDSPRRDLIRNACTSTIQRGLAGGRGNLWNLYQALIGAPFDSKKFESPLFTIIDDITEDFDTPSEYENMIDRFHTFVSRSWTSRTLLYAQVFLSAGSIFRYFIRRRYMRTPVPPAWKKPTRPPA